MIQQLKLPKTSDDLAKNVTATNPLDTVLIEIAVTDTDPNRAADIANGVAKQLSRVVQDIESPQSGAPAPVKLTTTQPASVPTAPVAPRKSLNLALGLLVGLAAGAGGALLREQLNTTVKTPDDIETLTGSVPLARGAVRPDGRSPAARHRGPGGQPRRGVPHAPHEPALRGRRQPAADHRRHLLDAERGQVDVRLQHRADPGPDGVAASCSWRPTCASRGCASTWASTAPPA